MRTSAEQPRLGIQTRRTRQNAAASFGGAAAVFLTLPAISNDVPHHAVSKENDKDWLEIAKLCAGLVSDDELDITDKTSAKDIVTMALSAWASKHCADINQMDRFTLVATLERDAFYLDYGGGDELPGRKFFVAMVSEQETPYFKVKSRIEALESAYPGLGRTAVDYAEQAGYRTFTIFSPLHGFYQAQNMYWMGADNDEDVKEEYSYMGEEMDEETLLPSTYKKAFSELYFSGDSLEREALQRIASKDDQAAEVAGTILTIMDMIDRDYRLPDLGEYCIDHAFFSCVMGMGEEHCMLDRVLDDFDQTTYQSGDGFTDIYGIAEIQVDHASFQKWRENMENGFRLYRELDRLMGLIGEKHNKEAS